MALLWSGEALALGSGSYSSPSLCVQTVGLGYLLALLTVGPELAWPCSTLGLSAPSGWEGV